MKQPPPPRIIRKETPPPTRGRDGYLKVREHLRRDFDYRCAYCMIHEQQIGGTEGFWIDHFKPRSKDGRINDYANLYWACIGCNRSKGESWPTPAQRRQGARFVDPCREQDYGVHFTKNEHGELVPQTPCGEYHVTRLRLNRLSRVAYRRARNRITARLADALAIVEWLEQEPATELNRATIAHIRQEIE
jgi:5-methylcytosine-specific restriction endonuclease McrA